MTVDVWAVNSNQTFLMVLCYLQAGGNEAIQGLCKMLASLSLADHEQ